MKIFVPAASVSSANTRTGPAATAASTPNSSRATPSSAGPNQGVYAEVEPHPTSLLLTSTTPDGRTVGPREMPMEPKALLREGPGGRLLQLRRRVSPTRCSPTTACAAWSSTTTRTDLPIKKGLSSSAAICVLTARAFNRVYDLRLTIRGEMELAYLGEITTPSRCGRMDQGCAYGDRAVLMTFDGDRLNTERSGRQQNLHFVIVDLRAGKNTLEILKRLNRSYPFAEGPARARRAGAARADQQADRERGARGPRGGRRRAPRAR